MTEAQLVQETAADVQLEILGTDLDIDLCQAARVIIQFFRGMEKKTSRWKLWVRAVYSGAIAALELLVDVQCRR